MDRIWLSACQYLVFYKYRQVRISFRPVEVLPGEFVFLECQQNPLQSFRKSAMGWFWFQNTLNCFDCWRKDHRYVDFSFAFMVELSFAFMVELSFAIGVILDNFAYKAKLTCQHCPTLVSHALWGRLLFFPSLNSFACITRQVTPFSEAKQIRMH